MFFCIFNYYSKQKLFANRHNYFTVMKKQILILVAILLVFTTCRKKSDISITAWNYALGEPIANAEIMIVESQYKGGLFNAGTECKEIAIATTDANGQCFFNNLKLKTKSSVQYAAKIKYSYGKPDLYNCNVTENSEVKVEKTNKLVLNSSSYKSYIRVYFNNILKPSQLKDSIWYALKRPVYQAPSDKFPNGGGSVVAGFFVNNGNNYNSLISTNMEESIAGKHVLKVYKKKMGIISITEDTIKIYPYEYRNLIINW